jgi:phosphatidylserine/phosphatidylglycerophosphate/cardiolipin synthase-like enzyme
MIKIISFVLLLISTALFADTFEQTASYKVCFTPKQPCTDLIVDTINQAQKEILVQAYSFTSRPIAQALTRANKRGVQVKIILDKSQYRSHGFSPARLFQNYQIPVFIDYQRGIAHNKVMVIDDKTVITGSFNFTRAAQEKNVENVIIISDSILAKKYKNNWQGRADQSQQLGASHY